VLGLVHGTMLLPAVTSLKGEEAPAAKLYRVGFILPNPYEPKDWLISARMPAKVGAAADVPPTGVRSPLLMRNPLVQLA
jgi:hypothetical protein